MKITYRREMKHNYLIVDPESLTWRNYECRMLAANSIEGVLHFQIRQVDDEIRFYYEITSRQPLGRMLESQSVRTEELRGLVLGISRVLDRMEQYLLREGSVLLEPEYIYVEPETFRIWLCLVPGLERDFPEDYGKLLEYLLGKVDHQDKDSVVLAYGLYQETRKENYGMEDILRLLRTEQGGQEAEQREDEARVDMDTDTDVKYEEIQNRKSRDGGAGKKKPGIWSRLRTWWSGRRAQKEPEVVRVPWEMMFHEEDDGGARAPETVPQIGTLPPGRTQAQPAGWTQATLGQTQPSQPRPQPAPSWQPPPHPQPPHPQPAPSWQPPPHPQPPEPGQDTVLLADLTPDNSTKLRCLRALDQDLGDITISYYPFIIGKQENLVDFMLPYDTVSRLHLRIDRDDGRYFVQDLNSTNGTTVAGHLLENNESAQIQEGDEIHIAKYRYRFE